VPDTGRSPDVSTLTPGELERTRRDLAASLALARSGSPARAPIGTHLAAIDAELASRASQREAPDPAPPDGGRHMPGPPASTRSGTGPDLEEIRGPLEDTRHLRMALDLLEERLPPAYACDGLESELWALREKIDAAELAQLRTIGHREYLVIQPLAPAAAGPLIAQAAQAVKTLDDLGLVIRLV
jgi:hypothetical protein